MNTIVSASILSADICHLADELDKLRAWQVDMLHFDVMDGIFVPNISFGIPMLSAVRSYTDMFLDVHLMITDPLRYAQAFAEAGADRITFHLESNSDPRATLEAIRSTGCKAGIALKPATPPEAVFPYLSLTDMVLVMTVEPGFGGQSYLPDMTDKIRQLHRAFPDLCIQVDGGINEKTASLARGAGASELVTGSYLFQSPDPALAAALVRGENTSPQAV